MIASSPYAPRRSSSSVGRAQLRRSSSSLIANSSVSIWVFLQFWQRLSSGRSTGDNRGPDLRGFLQGVSDAIASNLVAASLSERSAGDANPRSRRISSILGWIVTILGGERSRLGRVVTTIIGYTREVLLRSIGASCVILTGGSTSFGHLPRGDDRDTGQMALDCQLAVGDLSLSVNYESESDNLHIGTVLEDRCAIDSVISYWFRASPDRAQKTLWMIASSSVEQMNRIDSEISDRFRGTILDLARDEAMKCRWTDRVDLYGWRGKIAAIVALDQMSRHIHRHDKTGRTYTNNLPEQRHLDKLAYSIALKLQSAHESEIESGVIPIPMRIFGIMPLRHASTISDLERVQHDVESSAALHEEMDRMIRRFRKATNRRMAALQDEARREGKIGTKTNSRMDGKEFDDDQILECFPFEADMATACDHPVTKTISSFLRKMDIMRTSDARFRSPREAFSSSDNEHEVASKGIPTAIISLSGGVDSMVIAAVLAHLRDIEAGVRNAAKDKVLRIVAIHIDYANRPESGAEAAYVERFSERLGIEFKCRKIDEITRGVTARDDYERMAREIRFDLYRRTCSEVSSDGTVQSGVGIMLGHHRGDLRENVLSNAHRGCGPLDLSGMTEVSTNDGVALFRPLLFLEKSFIYDYSHTYGVPYFKGETQTRPKDLLFRQASTIVQHDVYCSTLPCFKDTTPHWSTRGKLRNRLLPLLEEIYGEGSMNNLSTLAMESDDAKDLVGETVVAPFMSQVNKYPMGFTFETAPWKGRSLFFWKFVLRQVLHSSGRGMFSDKSVASFLERIRVGTVKEGWLQCRKDYAVYLKRSGKVLIFHPDSFPFNKRDAYKVQSTPIAYGSRVEVGPWQIVPEIADSCMEDEAEAVITSKALADIDQLMLGDLRYFVKAPIPPGHSLPRPLIRISGFKKQTRPAAWKGLDLRIEQTLPLLGIDHTCDDEIGDETWALVKVRLSLKELGN